MIASASDGQQQEGVADDMASAGQGCGRQWEPRLPLLDATDISPPGRVCSVRGARGHPGTSQAAELGNQRQRRLWAAPRGHAEAHAA